MGVLRGVAIILAVGAAAVSVAGCDSTLNVSSPPEFTTPTLTVQDSLDVKYYPSDEPLKLALEYFDRSNYGLALRYFMDATEKAPEDATAWIGLAACYDRINRFDLADRAYAQAIKLVGQTTEILNNQGYSYMLRGNLPVARAKFLKAYEREPDNPTIINNLQLLNSSYKYIKREPDPRGTSPR
jgi:Flp pilus assembly protein TadD